MKPAIRRTFRQSAHGPTPNQVGTRRRRDTRRFAGHRRGAIMVVVMICFVLITLLLTSVLRIAAFQRRQVRQEQYRVQAGWLAESGLWRASHRLAESAHYNGETWTITAEELGGQSAAEVRIRVEPAGSQSNRRTVRAEAVYPTGQAVSVRRTKQITIQLAPVADSGAPGASPRGDNE